MRMGSKFLIAYWDETIAAPHAKTHRMGAKLRRMRVKARRTAAKSLGRHAEQWCASTSLPRMEIRPDLGTSTEILFYNYNVLSICLDHAELHLRDGPDAVGRGKLHLFRAHSD
jgi:hypothetical protein